MAVYVDEAVNRFGRMIMCHMIAESLEELHAMADRIGMKRAWFQNKALGTPHYDLSKSKRERALAAGAIEMDRDKTVELIRRWRAAGPGAVSIYGISVSELENQNSKR